MTVRAEVQAEDMPEEAEEEEAEWIAMREQIPAAQAAQREFLPAAEEEMVPATEQVMEVMPVQQDRVEMQEQRVLAQQRDKAEREQAVQTEEQEEQEEEDIMEPAIYQLYFWVQAEEAEEEVMMV